MKHPLDIQRRTFLGRGVAGLGTMALGSLWAAPPTKVRFSRRRQPAPFPPKAKRVIFLYQAGGPSHLETFDPNRSSLK